MTRVMLLIVLGVLLSGCGQSGDLYLPSSQSATSFIATGDHGPL